MYLEMNATDVPPHLAAFFEPVPVPKAKSLLLTPERFAIAMQDAGWWVRSRIAWCKTSAMPESVRDRPTSAWEHVWMFTKSARYFYDGDAVRQAHAPATTDRRWVDGKAGGVTTDADDLVRGNTWANSTTVKPRIVDPRGANLRNFWLLGPSPSSEAHFATFPPEIPRRCIKAATSEKGACPACGAPWGRVVERERFQSTSRSNPTAEYARSGRPLRGPSDAVPRPIDDVWTQTTGWRPGCGCFEFRCPNGCGRPIDAESHCVTCDSAFLMAPLTPVPQTVLDPFLGSGTTALVADQLGRHAIGIELSPAYAELARKRIANDAPMLSEPVTVEQPVQMPLLAEVAG